ncbi:hypothetical protein J2Z26_000219 [Bacillus luteolus]|nr:hypothetical protein [Cytobacillus luteolus]
MWIRTRFLPLPLNLSEYSRDSDLFSFYTAQLVGIRAGFRLVCLLYCSTCRNPCGIRTCLPPLLLNLSESVRYSDLFASSTAQPVEIRAVFGLVCLLYCSTCRNPCGIQTCLPPLLLNLSESLRDSDLFASSITQPVRILTGSDSFFSHTTQPVRTPS